MGDSMNLWSEEDLADEIDVFEYEMGISLHSMTQAELKAISDFCLKLACHMKAANIPACPDCEDL